MSSGRIDFTAPEAVQAALATIGRTESVDVSPDGSRLALTAFHQDKVLVFAFAMRRDPDAVDIQLPGYVAVSSDGFREPHGCIFLDRDHLLVCNRAGNVTLVRVPEPDVDGRQVRVRPQAVIPGRGYLRAVVKTPGSAIAYGIGDRRYRAFVCSDQWHFVTSHIIDLGRTGQIVNEGIRIEAQLQIPDGISLSPDHQWIAVSNHVRGEVQLFDNSRALDRHASPRASLGGSVCPHGLTFDAAGNLYVADAASPYVHVYDKPHGPWKDCDRPSQSFQLLDHDTFYRGRYAGREGGVKGVHVDRDADVLITTHKLGTLEFYDLPRLRSSVSEIDAAQLEALRAERDRELVRTKGEVLTRQWSVGVRVRKELGAVAQPVRENVRRVLPRLERLRLTRTNRRSTRPLLDPAGPVVSMTSHSMRIAWAYLAIESIARGVMRPRRLLLWLSDAEGPDALPESLRRLADRGLEVRYTPDLGPHTKYFPYVASEARLADPLVTADDDVVYPQDWLAVLVQAHRRNPAVIHCHRARRMRLNRYHFQPYGSWAPAARTEPHPLNFAIGASGVIYPPTVLQALKDNGTAFQDACPKADDIWLNRTAHREGVLVAQVRPRWSHFPLVPASQLVSLSFENVASGGNQLQLARTYSADDRAKLWQLAAA